MPALTPVGLPPLGEAEVNRGQEVARGAPVPTPKPCLAGVSCDAAWPLPSSHGQRSWRLPPAPPPPKAAVREEARVAPASPFRSRFALNRPESLSARQYDLGVWCDGARRPIVTRGTCHQHAGRNPTGRLPPHVAHPGAGVGTSEAEPEPRGVPEARSPEPSNGPFPWFGSVFFFLLAEIIVF